MIELTRFNLLDEAEWTYFYDLFRLYLSEVCDEKEYQENIADLHDDKLNEQMIAQTLQEHNPYFVMRIMKDRVCAGLISYSFDEEHHKGFINNFFVCPKYRNSGIGSITYRMVENHLQSLGAKYVELIPAGKAERFYLHNGFGLSRISPDGERIFCKDI